MIEQQTIMLIDSDDTVRSSIARLLTEHAYAVIECSDCGEALTRLHRIKPPALIVSELSMPGLGVQAFRLLQRGIFGFDTVPFVVMSSSNLLANTAAALGAAASAAKPIDPTAFVDLIKRLTKSGPTP